MSQENVAVVRRLYERFPDLAGSPPAEALVAEFFDPAVHVDLTRRVLLTRSASHYALESGRIVRLVVYENPSAALEPLGLRE